MFNPVHRLMNFLTDQLWSIRLDHLPWWQAWPLAALRTVVVVGRDLADGQLNLRAMSLVYTTLLSLVPMLAVSFSVLKAFGVHNQIEPFLQEFLAPLGPRSVEIVQHVIGFVENMKVGVLGAIGIGFLIYTAIALMQKIETALNYTWHVKKLRPLSQRFSNYLSVILVGPVLVFSALGMTASIMGTDLVLTLSQIEPFGTLIQFATRLLPYALVILAFTFIYVFIPNTRVSVGAALVGGVVAGILWQTTGWVFASFVVSSAKYTAIYSAFASLVMFMLWLYLTWLILLVGASIAFYAQYPNYLTLSRAEMRLSGRVRERVALHIMHLVGRSHYEQGPRWSGAALAEALRLPMELVDPVLETLEDAGLLVENCDEEPVYLPGRPLDTTTVDEVLRAVRCAGETRSFNPGKLPAEARVDAVIQGLETACDQALAGQTLKTLALGTDAGEGGGT
ncbi:MAG: YihY family inner membrane protein [Gammaproteobacteria bacterium]|nr:YihY family inner membrane protein [Gammaproteobacteria bacterium]MDX5375181.1 YihY family inner membrane protein [Gammaproteobacteria bacterium]